MGRLSSLTTLALALGATAACDRPTTEGSPAGRSESIVVADSMAAPAADSSAAQTASAHASAAPSAKPARRLCESDLARAGRRLPKGTFTPVAVSGPVPSARVTSGAKRWTWINFFAAWCGPCKEEMPRLRTFQERLAANLEVTFVSVDDDERQLKQFLTAQPARGVQAALWLEPKSRSAWLSALDMKDPLDLPAHVLVDPAGRVRCVLGGAIDDADFPAIAAIVRP